MFAQDWLGDEALQRCGWAAKGLWFELCLKMRTKGVCWAPGDLEEVASWFGRAFEDERELWARRAAPLVAELEEAGVFDRGGDVKGFSGPEDAMVSRRYFREWKESRGKSERGRRAAKARWSEGAREGGSDAARDAEPHAKGYAYPHAESCGRAAGDDARGMQAESPEGGDMKGVNAVEECGGDAGGMPKHAFSSPNPIPNPIPTSSFSSISPADCRRGGVGGEPHDSASGSAVGSAVGSALESAIGDLSRMRDEAMSEEGEVNRVRALHKRIMAATGDGAGWERKWRRVVGAFAGARELDALEEIVEYAALCSPHASPAVQREREVKGHDVLGNVGGFIWRRCEVKAEELGIELPKGRGD